MLMLNMLYCVFAGHDAGRLCGPLAECGFLFGAAAQAYFDQQRQAAAALGDGDDVDTGTGGAGM